MCVCVYITLSPTVYQSLKNNSQNFTQTKIKPFYCTMFAIAPVKKLVRKMKECTTEFSK